MKKTLLTFVGFFAIMSMALAQTISWTSADWVGVADKAQTISLKAGDFTLTADKAAGTTNPTVASANDLRVYASGTLNLASSKNFQRVVMNVSKKGHYRLAEITVDAGDVAIDTEAWTVTWTGDANNVTFTVGAKAEHGTDGPEKAGQLCLDNIVVGEGGGNVTPDPTPDPEPQPEPEEGNVVFSADFASDMCGFVVVDKQLSEGLTEVWSYNSKYHNMKASASVGKDHVPHVSESWAVSPVIDLTNVKDAHLTFVNKANFFGSAEGFLAACSVKVKEEGAAEWKNVVVENPASGMSWDKVTSTADLKTFDGKKVQIAFVYTSTTEFAGTWEFVNVEVAAGQGSDVKPEPQPEPEATVYSSIADLKKNAAEKEAKVVYEFKDLLVTGKAKNDIYVTDGTESTLFYGSENTLNVGDKISGKVKGNLVSYHGLTELKSVDYNEVKVVSSNNTVVPMAVTLGELAAEGSFAKYESMLVTVRGVKVEAANWDNFGNVNMVDGTSVVTLRDNYKSVESYEFDTNATYDFVGVIGQFKGKTQINLLSADGIQLSTGIESVETENGAQVIYDLSGRRVAKAVKGLYIVNGKKVYVK